MGTPILHIRIYLQVLGNNTTYVKKKVANAIYGSRGSCLNSDKYPQVMFLMPRESVSVWVKDYKYENFKSLGVWC